jgi:nitrate reductase gamma subunit
MNVLNTFLLVAFPYVAVIVFAVGVVYRYRQRGFTVSSLSSQFLEGRQLFWGTVPFHIGILVVFAGHLIAFLLPQATLAWNRIPVRLITLEVADLTPYLWSLVTLSPETGPVFALPWVIKLHIIGAFAILFMVPFTRLVHFVVAPLHYVIRPYQQVIWNWDRRTIRDPGTAWNKTRPQSQ